jgi:integrase
LLPAVDLRYVPMTQRLTAAVKQYRHLRGRRVLTRENSRALAEHHLTDLLAKVGRRANVRSNGPHILRHTFCSHLAMKGAPARAIQELAGHRDLATTQGYMHLSPSAIVDAIRLLEGAQNFGDISNDVGRVKPHVARSGRRSRLSRAKSRRRRPCPVQ